MTILSHYIQQEEKLKRLQKELEDLKANPQLEEELKFKDKLIALMTEYGKTEKEVLSILAPESYGTKKTATDGRAKRRTKRYVNPHTNEVVETKGGNHLTIKTWKKEYGDDVVNGWFSFID